MIVRVRVALKKTVVGDWHFDNLSRSHLQSQVNSVCQSMMLQVWSVESDWSTEKQIETKQWLMIYLTMKMTSTQVVKTSVTNNSSFQNYPHLDNHTIQTTDTPGFKPFTVTPYTCTMTQTPNITPGTRMSITGDSLVKDPTIDFRWNLVCWCYKTRRY